MTAFEGKADMIVCGNPLSRSLLGAKRDPLHHTCLLMTQSRRRVRRGADAGMTTHELMAISGHKTLSMVQLYTNDADRKRLADSAIAKLQDQSENTRVTNAAAQLHKHTAKALKAKG
ncbi:MAG TPA: hypothetical protein VHT68_21365 [Pseudolabrys sp.]|nr:hypothetical protein [Pseudolabrys sp.]